MISARDRGVLSIPLREYTYFPFLAQGMVELANMTHTTPLSPQHSFVIEMTDSSILV